MCCQHWMKFGPSGSVSRVFTLFRLIWSLQFLLGSLFENSIILLDKGKSTVLVCFVFQYNLIYLTHLPIAGSEGEGDPRSGRAPSPVRPRRQIDRAAQGTRR